jgi:hypothetical protein
MPGSLQKPQANLAERNLILIAHRMMRKGCAGAFAQIDLCAGARRQFLMPGDEIRVQMSLNDMRDAQPALARNVEIEADVALRIDYGRYTVGADRIRCVRQATEIELFEDHRRFEL